MKNTQTSALQHLTIITGSSYLKKQNQNNSNFICQLTSERCLEWLINTDPPDQEINDDALLPGTKQAADFKQKDLGMLGTQDMKLSWHSGSWK